MVQNAPIPERCISETNAVDGERFLTLTTSTGDSFGAVITRLERPMRRGKKYGLSLKVSHCPPKRRPLKFGKAIVELADHKGCYLRIVGVDGSTGIGEIMSMVGPFKNKDWEKIQVELSPKNSDVQAIILQAWNDTNWTGGRTRHIFVDDLSPLVPKISR